MMTYETFLLLCAFAFVCSITPGPNNIMLMSSGTNFGFRRTVPHILGVNLGFSFLILCIGFGVFQIFEIFPVIHIVMQVACSLYLTYLAFKIATSDARASGVQGRAKPFSFMQAVLFQWVNPKAWTMALTAISLYSTSGVFVSVLAVGLAFTVVNLPCICFWVIMGQQFSRIITSPLRLKAFNYLMAGLLMATLLQIYLIS